jgi:hypothetical protein
VFRSQQSGVGEMAGGRFCSANASQQALGGDKRLTFAIWCSYAKWCLLHGLAVMNGLFGSWGDGPFWSCPLGTFTPGSTNALFYFKSSS